MARYRLAIAIPTYRRASILEANFKIVVEAARSLGVAFYVSDDSPDDETEMVVRRIATDFADIHYRRNMPALGHDANLILTLRWPDADYVWLLGDSLWVRPDILAQVMAFLDDQDLLCVNSHSSDKRMIPGAEGEEGRTLLRDALWHQTLTGATIYHRRVRNWMCAQGDALLVKRNFPQLSMILGYASSQPARIGWFGERAVGSVERRSYWRDKALDVFVDDWVALVCTFPAIVSERDRAAVIKSHSSNMYLFDAPLLLQLKDQGQFGWSTLARPHFMDAMHLSRWKIWALLAFPTRLSAFVRGVKVHVTRRPK